MFCCPMSSRLAVLVPRINPWFRAALLAVAQGHVSYLSCRATAELRPWGRKQMLEYGPVKKAVEK